MLADCAGRLDEPFRRSEIMGWFRRHHPEVNEATLAAHIQAATANAANRERNFPGVAGRPPLLQRIDHGLYVRASAAPQALTPAGGSAPDRVVSRPRVADRARRNVEALISGFDGYVRRFEASDVFTGPSLYFHERALQRRRLHATAAGLVADERFVEYVYAVLPSWGMHRMGAQRAKVADFATFAMSLQAAAPVIQELWPLRVTALQPGNVPEVSEMAWHAITTIRASTSDTQIVAGSKTLHHVLPDLIPPMDRQYTFRFFTGQKAVITGDHAAFLAWFPYIAEIGGRCSDAIDAALDRRGMLATSPAKIIDNAIIGFMQAATEPTRRT